ncbi:hypothetical protein [Zavarzinella formosa]|uniref:hypothetical protein n=1 Tax=Zavarzinella formosa TaxID=360055 RepID=UPI00031E4F05|nr:hypothetical protein [Zavarzinella formosa]
MISNDLLLFIIVFLLVLCLLWHGVLSLFLFSVYRTMRMVRPEHRNMAPGLVWLCLIPLAGVIAGIWMVHSVASSLRKQFKALGEADPNDSYGLWPGLICLYGLIISTGLRMADGMLDGEVFTKMPSTLLRGISFVAWIVYWVKINECRLRLQRHFTTPVLSPEEFDYADDMRKRESDRNGET